jgi:hypothetical protein
MGLVGNATLGPGRKGQRQVSLDGQLLYCLLKNHHIGHGKQKPNHVGIFPSCGRDWLFDPARQSHPKLGVISNPKIV